MTPFSVGYPGYPVTAYIYTRKVIQQTELRLLWDVLNHTDGERPPAAATSFPRTFPEKLLNWLSWFSGLLSEKLLDWLPEAELELSPLALAMEISAFPPGMGVSVLPGMLAT